MQEEKVEAAREEARGQLEEARAALHAAREEAAGRLEEADRMLEGAREEANEAKARMEEAWRALRAEVAARGVAAPASPAPSRGWRRRSGRGRCSESQREAEVRAGTRDVTTIDSQRGYPAMLGTLILNGP